ncbi:MAG: tetratricopeptide repeat protein [Pyrinomonadaceae bacterium]
MPIKFFFRASAVALLVALFAVAASAQVTQASGKVTLKQADGTTSPVKDAVIDFFRTDITQKFSTKTNAKGEYIHAGLPFTGIFTIAVSAPGARPTYQSNIKISQQGKNDFTLDPGDGTRLTLEQIKTAPTTNNLPTGATPAKLSAEDKKRAEEEAKEIARITAENQKITENNTKLPEILKSANDAFTAKKYTEAIGLFDQGIQLDPAQEVFHLNRSIALLRRGVDAFNTASKAKDVAGKESARADFKASTESAEKAVSAYTARIKGASAGGAQPATEGLDFLFNRAESYRVALQTSTPIDAEAAAKAFQEYIAAESDPTKKMKAQANLGDALFQGGKVDQAVATYRQVLSTNPSNLDAMYGLGIALAAQVTDATKDAALISEARQMLQQFVSKAPDTHPRKAEAISSVEYLDETMKGASASKADKPGTGASKGGRRKP